MIYTQVHYGRLKRSLGRGQSKKTPLPCDTINGRAGSIPERNRPPANPLPAHPRWGFGLSPPLLGAKNTQLSIEVETNSRARDFLPYKPSLSLSLCILI